MTSVVADLGSGTTRAGWSGDSLPSVLIEGYKHEVCTSLSPVSLSSIFHFS